MATTVLSLSRLSDSFGEGVFGDADSEWSKAQAQRWLQSVIAKIERTEKNLTRAHAVLARLLARGVAGCEDIHEYNTQVLALWSQTDEVFNRLTPEVRRQFMLDRPPMPVLIGAKAQLTIDCTQATTVYDCNYLWTVDLPCPPSGFADDRVRLNAPIDVVKKGGAVIPPESHALGAIPAVAWGLAALAGALIAGGWAVSQWLRSTSGAEVNEQALASQDLQAKIYVGEMERRERCINEFLAANPHVPPDEVQKYATGVCSFNQPPPPEQQTSDDLAKSNTLSAAIKWGVVGLGIFVVGRWLVARADAEPVPRARAIGRRANPRGERAIP